MAGDRERLMALAEKVERAYRDSETIQQGEQTIRILLDRSLLPELAAALRARAEAQP